MSDQESQPIAADNDLSSLLPEAILDSVDQMVVVVDRRFRIVWINRAAQTCSILNRHERIIGRRCYRILAGKTSPCEKDCPVKPVFETGRPYSVEKKAVADHGGHQWFEARAYPIFDRNGRVAYSARLSFDITRLKNGSAKAPCELEIIDRALNLKDGSRYPVRNTLTAREMEVISLLAQGMTNPQIADTLDISPHTAKRHVMNIFNKLGVNDRTQAAVWAARENLI